MYVVREDGTEEYVVRLGVVRQVHHPQRYPSFVSFSQVFLLF